MRNNRLLLLPFAAFLTLGLAACEEGVEEDQAALEENGAIEEDGVGEEEDLGLAEADTEEDGMLNEDEQATDFAAAGEASGEEIEAVAVAESEEYGQYLVSDDGRAVYLYFADSQGQSNCTGQCAEMWPPVLAENGKPQVDDPSIDQAKLGTIQREDGTQQVTYDGHPLYFYAEDAGPGEAEGQGVNNEWALVTTDGKPVRDSRARGSAQL